MTAQTVANYINGEWEAPASGKYLDNPNPATNKVFSRIPHSEQADVDKAVAAAKEAYKTWRKTTNKERSDLLNKIADALEAQLETLAKLESTDTVCPLYETCTHKS